MTFLKDGRLVVCDKNNMTIKLFDRNLIMTYDLDVGSTPYDIAAVEEGLVNSVISNFRSTPLHCDKSWCKTRSKNSDQRDMPRNNGLQVTNICMHQRKQCF